MTTCLYLHVAKKRLADSWIQVGTPYKYYSLYEDGNSLCIEVENEQQPFQIIKLNDVVDRKQTIEFLGDGIIKLLTITIEGMYPFRGPNSISVNGQPYLSLLSFSCKELFPDYIKNKLNMDKCLCCQSLVCPNNWIPSNHLKDVLQEVINNMELKSLYSYMICINVIKRKYLNPDIPLIDFFIPKTEI